MEHVYEVDHNLVVCTVCGLYEGGLTTDCSGEMSVSKADDIYKGKLDYREGLGWIRGLNPTNKSVVYGKIYSMKVGRERAPKHKNEIMLMFGIGKEEYREIESLLLKDLYIG